MNPADWILDLDRSLNQSYEEAVGKLELLFIENTEWIKKRKEIIVNERIKSEQLRIEKEEIARKNTLENRVEKQKEKSISKNKPLARSKKVEIKKSENKKENIPKRDIPSLKDINVSKKKQSKIAVVEIPKESEKNEDNVSEALPAKKKRGRPAKLNAAAKLADNVLSNSPVIAPKIVEEISIVLLERTLTEEDEKPANDLSVAKTDQPIAKGPSPIKLLPDLATVHIPVVSSPSMPTNKVESWMSQMMKKESIVPIHNSPPKEPFFEPPKQQPIIQKVSPIKVEPVVQSKSLKPAPKQNSPDHRSAAVPKPECYAESPLTRAKRIDSQNTWREQQLSKFFVSRAEFLKSSLSALREVKEQERSSLGAHVPIERPVVDTRQAVEEKPAPEKFEEEHFQLEILSGPPTPRIPMRAIPKESSPKPPAVCPEVSNTEIKVFESPKKPLVPIPVVAKKESLPSEIRVVENKPSVEPASTKSTDVFRLVSPLKKKSRLEELPTIDNSIEAEFIGTFAPPTMDFVKEDDLPLNLEEVTKQLPDDDIFNVTRKEPSVSKVLDKEEEARRERLKERQRLAIEKRNMLMKKAQESKAPKIDDASIFRPKPMTQPFSRPGQQSGSNIIKTGTGSTASALHKTAMLNASKSLSIKTEIKAPPVKVKSPAPIKMAEKVLSSPTLPEIPSDDEEYLRKAAHNAGNRPEWAQTPALKAALQDQQTRSAGKVFQNIQPVRLEDIFKNKTFKRGRNSTIPFM